MFLKKLNFSTLFLLAVIILISACQHDTVLPDPISNPDPTIGDSAVIGTNSCDPDSVYFQREVLPILLSSCAYAGCHNAGSHREGVILDSYSNTKKTGGVKPGNASTSKMYRSLTGGGEDRMPPSGSLPSNQIVLIKDWINQGAKDLHCDECDTTTVSYPLIISKIIDSYCSNCHNSSRTEAGVRLNTYNDLLINVQNGNLLGTINHTLGYQPMPPSGSLSDCELQQINLWIAAGTPKD